MSCFDEVDELLMAKYRRHLEDVLCDGCLIGRLTSALGERSRIMPRLTRSIAEEDGGLVQSYEGILVLDDVWYRFACQLFVDRGGQRFLSDITAFDAIEWQAEVKVPA